MKKYKSTQTIIMHYDVHVFQLSKMECKYSEFIEIKEQMEHLKKENDILKQELSKDMKQFNNDLQQQINSTSYYLPVVFISNHGKHQIEYYGDEQYIHELQHVLSGHQMILLRGTNLRIAFANQKSCGTSLNKIIIPQKKNSNTF